MVKFSPREKCDSIVEDVVIHFDPEQQWVVESYSNSKDCWITCGCVTFCLSREILHRNFIKVDL